MPKVHYIENILAGGSKMNMKSKAEIHDLTQLDHNDSDEIFKKIGVKDVVLLTLAVMACTVFFIGGIVFFMIKWLAGKVVGWKGL